MSDKEISVFDVNMIFIPITAKTNAPNISFGKECKRTKNILQNIQTHGNLRLSYITVYQFNNVKRWVCDYLMRNLQTTENLKNKSNKQKEEKNRHTVLSSQTQTCREFFLKKEMWNLILWKWNRLQLTGNVLAVSLNANF